MPSPLTWTVRARDTGEVVLEFGGPASLPEAQRSAIASGFDLKRYDVRAVLEVGAFAPTRKPFRPSPFRTQTRKA